MKDKASPDSMKPVSAAQIYPAPFLHLCEVPSFTLNKLPFSLVSLIWVFVLCKMMNLGELSLIQVVGLIVIGT